MSFKINSNILGMNAANQINSSYSALEKSINRLSSGNRINTASDDAAGLSIADSLKSQALSMGQAVRNANDAISITQIADGALDESVNLINTIRTKAIQAANGSQSTESRAAIQSDIDNALASLDRIAQTTSFNGQKLLSGDFTSKSFQIGAYSGETVELSIDSTEASQLGDAETGSLSDIDVTTSEGAQSAIKIAEEALKQVDAVRSNIGSTQNQLSSSINNLQTTMVNVYASESQVREVDFAEEVMNNSNINNLMKAKMFAASQANASQKRVLSLLS